MTLSRVISEISCIVNVVTLTSGSEVRGHSRSLKIKWHHFDRLGMVSYYCSIVQLSLSRTVFRYSTIQWPWNSC